MDTERLDRLGLKHPPRTGPKILLYDIETSANLVWAWSLYKMNAIAVEQDWYLLSAAWKWLDDEHTHFFSIYQDPSFAPDTTEDRFVAERLYALFDEADIIVAHNGNRFDQKKSNAVFFRHGWGPPADYQQIDTLLEYRKHLGEASHKLKEIARRAGRDGKVLHHGWELWRDCMRGEPDAWRLMERYNRQDVRELESAYRDILPWIGYMRKGAHPNMGHWAYDEDARCPNCGGRETLVKKGFRFTPVSRYQRFWCKPSRGGCGAWGRARLRERDSYPLGGPQVR